MAGARSPTPPSQHAVGVIAVGLVNIVRPGARIDRTVIPARRAGLQSNAQSARVGQSGIVELIPAIRLIQRSEPWTARAAVHGLRAGLRLAIRPCLRRTRAAGHHRVLEQVFDACMRIVHFVMRVAPVAVFAIILNTTLTFGSGIFAALLLYVLTVVVGRSFTVRRLRARDQILGSPVAARLLSHLS